MNRDYGGINECMTYCFALRDQHAPCRTACSKALLVVFFCAFVRPDGSWHERRLLVANARQISGPKSRSGGFRTSFFPAPFGPRRVFHSASTALKHGMLCPVSIPRSIPSLDPCGFQAACLRTMMPQPSNLLQSHCVCCTFTDYLTCSLVTQLGHCYVLPLRKKL